MAIQKESHHSASDGQPVSREDVRRRHKKRARLLMWKRVAIVVALFLGMWLVWRNWDVLAPDKLLAKLQDVIGGHSGSYPVDISGTQGKALVSSENYTVLLNDSYLTYYNDRGGEVTRHACTYSSALVRAAGKYVLVAEQDGKRAMLTTRSGKPLHLELEQKILSVDVNEKGQMAVLIQGAQNYAVEVIVYDKQGKELYRRKRSALANDVTLSPDGKTVAMLSLDATGGVLSSVVEAFSMKSTDTAALYTHKAAGTVLYRLRFLHNDCMVAVGESGARVMPLSGNAATYATDGQQVLGYAVAQDSVALVTRQSGVTDGGTVTVLNGDGSVSCFVSFAGEFRQLSAAEDRYLLLTDDMVQCVEKSGAGKKAIIPADGYQAVLNDDTAIVLGLSSLQQYTLV